MDTILNTPRSPEVIAVVLVLENCESVTIDRKHIGMLDIRGITKTITRIACNSVRAYQTCATASLEIHKDANKTYDSFGQPSESLMFDRLTESPDITCLEIHYDDGSCDAVYPPWEDSTPNGCNNKNQSAYVSDCGHLYIAIDPDNDILALLSDAGCREAIDDPEYMEDYWAMTSEYIGSEPIGDGAIPKGDTPS